MDLSPFFGLAWRTMSKSPNRVGLGYDLHRLEEDFELQDNNGNMSNTPAGHDKIGDEFDINLRYRATEYLYFRLGTGWLFNANALGLADDINVTIFQAVLRF